jgi:hypothetical protein
MQQALLLLLLALALELLHLSAPLLQPPPLGLPIPTVPL